MDESLSSRVFNDAESMFIFTDLDSNIIDVGRVILDNESKISAVITRTEDILYPDEVVFGRYALNIPGIGEVLPQTRIIYKDKDYVLLFGWHKNISNQEIYSWFLRPLEEDVPDKTLYKEMIDEIEVVHFR